jgi:hypothetical protein
MEMQLVYRSCYQGNLICHNMFVYSIKINTCMCHLGGVMVSVLAIGPKVCGFKPG